MNPYENLEPRAFWRTAIADLDGSELSDVYRPRFKVRKRAPIVAAGSCFAQHISREFKARGYNFIDAEPPPPLLPEELWHEYGYDLYSARYGNVYTARQLWQLIQRAFGRFTPIENVWEANGRYLDPFRPAIEPNGFSTMEEYRLIQERHLRAVAGVCERAAIFVFTFGLTEGWVHRGDGAVYPVCPGTSAGTFDESIYRFHNFNFMEILHDMTQVIEFLRSINASIRFLFTVSPVPLTATASGEHVLPATIYSKSVLRAVCGTLRATFDCVDYFPSYEIVASHPSRARFFEPNLRSVSIAGVQHVMSHFFKNKGPARTGKPKRDRIGAAHEDDLVCEEELLESFA